MTDAVLPLVTEAGVLVFPFPPLVSARWSFLFSFYWVTRTEMNKFTHVALCVWETGCSEFKNT